MGGGVRQRAVPRAKARPQVLPWVGGVLPGPCVSSSVPALQLAGGLCLGTVCFTHRVGFTCERLSGKVEPCP